MILMHIRLTTTKVILNTAGTKTDIFQHVNKQVKYWLNEYTSSIGLGVYHSGIEVYGKEYAFGGHPYAFTGIFDMEPKDLEELGEGFTFKETVVLGFTDYSKGDVINLTEMLGKSFLGSSYHLIKKNCNHFTNEFSQLLCGKNIPGWVNRLASIGTRFPFLAACIPKEWLTPDETDGPLHYVDLTEWEEIKHPDDNEDAPLLTLNEMLSLGDERANTTNTNMSDSPYQTLKHQAKFLSHNGDVT